MESSSAVPGDLSPDKKRARLNDVDEYSHDMNEQYKGFDQQYNERDEEDDFLDDDVFDSASGSLFGEEDFVAMTLLKYDDWPEQEEQ